MSVFGDTSILIYYEQKSVKLLPFILKIRTFMIKEYKISIIVIT